MKVAIDRFEGDYAVCEKEDRTMTRIEKNRLPEGVKEGDVLIVEGELITTDVDETARRRGEVNKLMDGLWK